MHMLISAIVYANNKEGAVAQAENIFSRLCEHQCVFDYYSLMEESDQFDFKKVMLASSQEGLQVIKNGFENTRDEFMTNIKEIRGMLDLFSDRQLFNKEYLKADKKKGGIANFRHYCSCLGRKNSPYVWLYDHNGEGITTPEHLKDVLNKYEEGQYQDLDIWVVPADVHF